MKTVDPNPIVKMWEAERRPPVDPRLLVEIRRLVDQVVLETVRQMQLTSQAAP